LSDPRLCSRVQHTPPPGPLPLPPPVDFFLQELVNGITLGSVYALLALGYSMVYGILKLLNFAHGDIYMIGAFIGYGIMTSFHGPASLSIPIALLLLLMMLGAMAGSAVLGVAVERFAYRRLRDAPRGATLITALGVSFFIENIAQLLFGAEYHSMNTFQLAGGTLFTHGIHLTANVYVALARIIVIVGAVLMMVALTLLVNRTRMGKAMRAVSFDREAASMMGINVDNVIVWTFFIGSALAGAAGVMVALVFQNVFPYMGFNAGLKAFTAAVVGGIGSIVGAMVGGVLVGLVESFAIGYIGGQWSDIVVFGILIAFMLFRPSGLFGSRAIQKV
jgi:branched-chain amino acid transport system permease protein